MNIMITGASGEYGNLCHRLLEKICTSRLICLDWLEMRLRVRH
jgi:hypothetical protein